MFNLFGRVVSWMSKIWVVVSLSTTEYKYMEATHASKEVVWLQRLCPSIGVVYKVEIFYFDSQSEIFMEKILAYHAKMKHIVGQ